MKVAVKYETKSYYYIKKRKQYDVRKAFARFHNRICKKCVYRLKPLVAVDCNARAKGYSWAPDSWLYEKNLERAGRDNWVQPSWTIQCCKYEPVRKNETHKTFKKVHRLSGVKRMAKKT